MPCALPIAHFLLLAAASSLPPQCQVETVPAAKAACIGLVAEESLHAADLALAGISTGVQGAEARTLAQFQAALMKLQRAWQTEMEAQCVRTGGSSETARQTCRFEAAAARQISIGRAVAEAEARLSGAEPFLAPDSIEIFIPLPRHRRAGPGALPYLCLDFPISGAAPGWSWCSSYH